MKNRKTKLVEFNGETLIVMEETDLLMFRELTEGEKKDYIQWAVDNPGARPSPLLHPVVQDYIIKRTVDKLN